MQPIVYVKKLHPDAIVPTYAHVGDSGADLYAVADVRLAPGEWFPVPCGFSIELPPGYEGQVRPKSGIALNDGVTVLNTVGTIDYGYRGEIKVLLINHGKKDYHVRKGQKIAQLVIAPVAYAQFVEAARLTDTVRGEGGFGSTGI